MEIKNSNIEGLGLYATQSYKSNTKLVDYIGEEMSLRDFREKYGKYKSNSLNTYRMKRINRIIVAKEQPYLSTNIVNSINESNTPNCILKKKALYTLTDIQAGDELTLKYPKDYCRKYTL